MTTWTQDYPALPGSAVAAAHYAQAVTRESLPWRADDAYKLAEQLLVIGIARSTPVSNMNLITEVDSKLRRVRFELHYANNASTPDPPQAHQLVSALSNACGEQDTRAGKMIYAELWAA